MSANTVTAVCTRAAQGMPGQASISDGIRQGCSIGNGVTIYIRTYMPHSAGCHHLTDCLPGMPSLRSCIPGYGVTGLLRMPYSRYNSIHPHINQKVPIFFA